MLTMAILLLGSLLLALLLVRAVQESLVRRFPIFYFYLLFVLVDDFLRYLTYRWYHELYPNVYWATQFLCFVIGSAVIFEVYRAALRSFPGTAKVARYALLLIFGVIFANAVAGVSSGLFAWFAQTCEDLEWKLRMVQALAILTLVVLFLWYAIPFGRNLRGILIGYGLFVGLSILQFTMLHYSWTDIARYWAYAQPFSYVVVLSVWTVALWSARPQPETSQAVALDTDYQELLASTRGQLGRALARLGWAARV
jgi:hypothetical protein